MIPKKRFIFRRLMVVLFLGLITIPFQNCSRGFKDSLNSGTVDSSSGNDSESNSPTSPPANSPTGQPLPPNQNPGAQNYQWYPALDLNQVEFHTGAGVWGPQRRLETPAAPITTRTVHVTTADQLRTAALVPGSQIIVDNDINSSIGIQGDIVDIDLIIPAGRTIGQLLLGQYNSANQVNRFRIRGPTIGEYSGGVVSGLWFLVPTGDVILDGIGLRDPRTNSPSSGGDGGILISFEILRIAVVNSVIHTAAHSWIGKARNMVVAGNSVASSDAPSAENGVDSGYSFRMYSEAAIFYQNRIEGSRYHRIRMHPQLDYTYQYIWIDSNIIVDRNEGRILGIFDLGPANNLPASNITGAFIKNNQIYAHNAGAPCIVPVSEFGPRATAYALASSNTFFGDFTLSGLSSQAASISNHNYTAGNTSFSAWQAPPAVWRYPGDPRTLVPLAPRDPAFYDANLVARDANCPGI